MRREDRGELPGARERVCDPGRLADVDPDAKRAAVGKVSDPLDADLDPPYDFPSPRCGVERWCRRPHLLGGAAQGDARCRRGKEASHGRP